MLSIISSNSLVCYANKTSLILDKQYTRLFFWYALQTVYVIGDAASFTKNNNKKIRTRCKYHHECIFIFYLQKNIMRFNKHSKYVLYFLNPKPQYALNSLLYIPYYTRSVSLPLAISNTSLKPAERGTDPAAIYKRRYNSRLQKSQDVFFATFNKC